MEQTFMTIHNLSADANILFASESIVDILGYQPEEVQGRPSFDYFHPDEVPLARSVHSRGVLLDKAAVLHYARILAKDGRWVSCECCFTIVHDVLVASTSIYRKGARSERRAIEAPQIRRLFSSSPLDPRYNMLEHMSPRFKMPPMEREPRAALILNRFTTRLTIMFATNAVSQILGLSPDNIKGKSFYDCIQENCLNNAHRCLESAKANDSIAYLRFWYRNPRLPREDEDIEEGDDEEGEDEGYENDEAMEGVHNSGDATINEMAVDSDERVRIKEEKSDNDEGTSLSTASARSSAFPAPIFNHYRGLQLQGGNPPSPPSRQPHGGDPNPSFELEAVVSCTSDGLVVVLRKARPPIPAPHPPLLSPFEFQNGLFAAPWGQQPIRPFYPPEMLYTFRPPLMPQFMPLRDNVKAAGGPPLDQLMTSIRDVAVFAWALVGINGNFAAYARGFPSGDAQPEGFPIWDPNTRMNSYSIPETQAVQAALRQWPGPADTGKTPALSAHPPFPPPAHPAESAQAAYSPLTTNYTFSSAPQHWPRGTAPSVIPPSFQPTFAQYSRAASNSRLGYGFSTRTYTRDYQDYPIPSQLRGPNDNPSGFPPWN